MTSRERVAATLRHERVDRLPRHIWASPHVVYERTGEYNRLLEKYPLDIAYAPPIFGPSKRAKGRMLLDLTYTDAFGVEWEAKESAVTGEVKKAPLADWNDGYELPWELLEGADIGPALHLREQTDQFVLADSLTRPFERMQFLHTTVNTFLDLAEEDGRLFGLLDDIHAFNLRELELWCQTDVDGVAFMDDWGSQTALLIAPALWRKHFKPLYKQYVDRIHKAGKYAFMHSDGNIVAIYGDIVEIGVDALNSQLFCMDIERLGREYGGKITFWGEIDRQYLLPFGTPDEVRAGVRRVAAAVLGRSQSGAIAHCSWGKYDGYENVEALYDEWMRCYTEFISPGGSAYLSFREKER